jgi:hypothetical protein
MTTLPLAQERRSVGRRASEARAGGLMAMRRDGGCLVKLCAEVGE